MVLTVGDLFCGAGGFSEGFRQAGFEIKWALDNWQPAVQTFEKNQGVRVISRDIMDVDFGEFEPVDVIIGSPPCRNFSLAKNGGNGDMDEDMNLVLKFFEAVLELNPDYWVMENVPNIRKSLMRYIDVGFIRLSNGNLKVPKILVLNSADYGVPQKRRRLFSGCFPIPQQTHKKDVDASHDSMQRWRSMKDVIGSLPQPLSDLTSEKMVKDPLYDIQIPENLLTEQSYITYLTKEEVFDCRKGKENHSWAGKMCFPDKLDLPSRTVTVYNRRSGRQTIVIRDEGPYETCYRRPTLREFACFQSFPITYQFWGKTIRKRYRLVGNAVPPLLAFAIAKAILKDRGYDAPEKTIINDRNMDFPPILLKEVTTKIGKTRKMPLTRRFQDHVPGSITNHSVKNACRVDLDNKGDNPRIHPMMKFESNKGPKQVVEHIVEWRTVLYTGYSKTIQSSPITLQDAIRLLLQAEHDELITENITDSFIGDLIGDLPYKIPDASTLQAVRARRCDKIEITPYKLLDIISNKIDNHFPIKSYDWSKRIKHQNHIKIAPETGIPVRTAAQLLACSFICEIINESDIWIRKNWNLHFHKKEWPQITGPNSLEPTWNKHKRVKEEANKYRVRYELQKPFQKIYKLISNFLLP